MHNSEYIAVPMRALLNALASGLMVPFTSGEGHHQAEERVLSGLVSL